MLISAKPDSKGKEAALARAKHLTDFTWTPLADIPTYTKTEGKTVHPKGKEVTGMPYSSTEPNDKFITENVSFETLLSAIANPDSALYKKDLNGHHNSWTYFGIVCNGLARYALGIRRRYSTKRWGTIPGMRKIADCEKKDVNEIKLCDVLYAYGRGRNHVALITDILSDDEGKIRQIEVSEAVRPSCERVRYEAEEFYEKYKLFELWRYDYVDMVPENDPSADRLLFKEGVSKTLPDIAVDYGNKSNYFLGEETVISVFKEGENEIEIYRDGKFCERLTLNGGEKITKKFEKGYYKIKIAGTEAETEFCVNSPHITHSAENGVLTVKADSCDAESKILYMEFREKRKSELNKDAKDSENLKMEYYNDCCSSLAKVEELSEKEVESGIISRTIPEDGANFKIYFENKYGVWTHKMIKI